MQPVPQILIIVICNVLWAAVGMVWCAFSVDDKNMIFVNNILYKQSGSYEIKTQDITKTNRV